MDIKGHVFLKKEFTATKLWPNKQITLNGDLDLEVEYKKALSGNLVRVMDIAVDGSGYLVIGQSEKVGDFLWQIEAEDVVQFIPTVKKYGILKPVGLSPLEEFEWLAKVFDNENE